jgi:hypothetical protein
MGVGGCGWLIGKICYRFCEGTEIRWTMIPSHGQHEGNGNQGVIIGVIWGKENCQL